MFCQEKHISRSKFVATTLEHVKNYVNRKLGRQLRELSTLINSSTAPKATLKILDSTFKNKTNQQLMKSTF